MSFVPNRDLKRLNPMSNDWLFFDILWLLDYKHYHMWQSVSQLKDMVEFSHW